MAHLVVAVAAAFASVLCTIGAFLIGSFDVSLIEFFVAGVMLYVAYLNTKKYLEAHCQKTADETLGTREAQPSRWTHVRCPNCGHQNRIETNAAKSADYPGRT